MHFVCFACTVTVQSLFNLQLLYVMYMSAHTELALLTEMDALFNFAENCRYSSSSDSGIDSENHSDEMDTDEAYHLSPNS